MTTITLVTKAYAHAARWHSAQRRKGASAEPYINHLAEVADLVAQATAGTDANLIAAAVLHDAIEDSGIVHATLVAEFNRDVADLVAEVTDDKSLEKQERKRLQVEKTPKKSPRAKLIKLADKCSNLRAILASPPVGWPLERKQEYLAWARQVAAGARGESAFLEAAFDEAALALERELAEATA